MLANPAKQDLVKLIGNESGRCVSILMRTHESGRETTQNPIRFKNLITEAIERVRGKDDKLSEQLEELAKLEHDFDFWQHQSAGFAVFVCANFEQRFKLSHRPKEVVYVGDQFLIRSLASVSCGGDSIRALALSWDQARWFACDGHEAYELQNEMFPVTKNDLVPESDAEEHLQFSTQGAKGRPGGNSGTMYHGQGEGEGKIEADRDSYLSQVGKMVADAIYNTDHKLLLLATDEVAGHFTSTSDVEVAKVVNASPDGIDDEAIKAKILEASHPLTKQSGKVLQERLGTSLANGTGSKDIGEIVRAAANGRIETLLVGAGESLRGYFDRESRKIEVDGNGETDLINLAVHETLQAGGSVARMPEQNESGNAIAAIYRY